MTTQYPVSSNVTWSKLATRTVLRILASNASDVLKDANRAYWAGDFFLAIAVVSLVMAFFTGLSALHGILFLATAISYGFGNLVEYGGRLITFFDSTRGKFVIGASATTLTWVSIWVAGKLVAEITHDNPAFFTHSVVLIAVITGASFITLAIVPLAALATFWYAVRSMLATGHPPRPDTRSAHKALGALAWTVTACFVLRLVYLTYLDDRHGLPNLVVMMDYHSMHHFTDFPHTAQVAYCEGHVSIAIPDPAAGWVFGIKPQVKSDQLDLSNR